MKKKLLSLLVLLAGAVSGASASYEVQIGEGDGTHNYFPFYTLYNYSISECLFLASELTAAGVEAGPITSISWYATNETGNAQQGINIWLANVTDTELTTSSHLATGMTQVYVDGTVTPVIGWNEFVLNGNFSWDGTSNLLILVQRNNGNWNSTINWQAGQAGFNATSYRYQDSSAYDVSVSNSMYTSQSRPNIIIKGESGAASGFDLTVGTTEHGTITYTNAAGKEITSAAEGDVVTVTVTPDEGWSVKEISGQWYAAIAAARSQSPSIDLLNSIELTPVEGQTNQWTFTMERANVEFSCTYNKLMTHSDITISEIPEQVYTGQALTPTFTVQDGSTTLIEGVHYTVTYLNNTGAGTASIIITAMEGTIYGGSVTITFTIQQKLIQRTWLTLVDDQPWTGAPITPKVVLKDDGKLLVENVDYRLEYWNNVDIGLAYGDVIGIGNYGGELLFKFNIVDPATTAIKATATAASTEGEWRTLDGRRLSGKPTRSGVYVKDGRKVMVK